MKLEKQSRQTKLRVSKQDWPLPDFLQGCLRNWFYTISEFFSSEPFNLLSSEDTRLFVLVSWMATPAVVYKPNLRLS